MKTLFKRQARQLYRALYLRGQTWFRTDSTIDGEWAEAFQVLASKYKYQRKRIRLTLEWYCAEGVGALYVPLVANAESFCEKFEQVDAARKRMKGQPLRYFDDILKYKFTPRKTGTMVQKQHAKVCQKLQQQIDYIDDLAHGRKTLPKVKPEVRKVEKTSKPVYSKYLMKARKKMTAKQKEQLDALLNVDRELLWKLLMECPNNQNEWHDRLEKAGFWKPFGDYFRLTRKQEAAAERENQDEAEDEDWEPPFDAFDTPKRGSVAMTNGKA